MLISFMGGMGIKSSLNSSKHHSSGFIIESLIIIAILLVLPFVACSHLARVSKCSRLEDIKLYDCLKRERLNNAPKAPR